MGGLGLQTVENHFPAAFASSYSLLSPSSEPYYSPLWKTPVCLSPALLDLITELQGEETTIDSLDGVTQKQLRYQIDQVLSSQVVECVANGISVREVARLTCLKLPHAGAWLNVVPSPALGLHLRASEFVTALKLRLGVNVFTLAGP